MPRRSHAFSPSRMILISVAVAITIGTALLALPICRTQDIPLIDLFFTATSSICVTGFMTIPLESFTQTGQIVVMFLMQIGGLGLITLTLFAVSLFVDLGLATQVMAGEMLELETWAGARKILFFITCLTVTCELLGTILIFQSLKHHYPIEKALFYSLFEAVSAFCNAGINIIGNGIQPYYNDYRMLGTLSILMLLGGIGFISLHEIINRYNPFKHRIKKILSLQTRIVLSAFCTLISINTIVFWLLERQNTFAFMTFPEQIMNALFTAISTRSAGFLTVYANDMQLASLFSMMVNSFIGSGPGSTGSGIKLTTAAIFVATINAAIKGKTSVEIKGRRLVPDQINKALAVVALSMLWISLVTFCLLITERSWHFIDILFETVGAFTTLGISIGITPYLSIMGKLLIIVTMFIGRIGSLTLLIALRKRDDRQPEFTYPQERVMIS